MDGAGAINKAAAVRPDTASAESFAKDLVVIKSSVHPNTAGSAIQPLPPVGNPNDPICFEYTRIRARAAGCRAASSAGTGTSSRRTPTWSPTACARVSSRRLRLSTPNAAMWSPSGI